MKSILHDCQQEYPSEYTWDIHIRSPECLDDVPVDNDHDEEGEEL